MPARVIFLLGLLAVQPVGWFWLSANMSPIDTPWLHWHPSRALALQEDQNGGASQLWFASVLFDVENERWWVEPDRYRARHWIEPPEPAFYWRVREHIDRKLPPTAEYVNRVTGEVIKQRDLPDYCELVDNRFAVYEKNDDLWWLDLSDDQATFQKFSSPAETGWIYWHCWSGPTIIGEREVSNPIARAATPWIDLIRFTDNGPVLVTSWPTFKSTNFYQYLDTGDTVASWDLSGTALEFRSKLDGQVVATEKMPPGLSAASMQWGLTSKVVHIGSAAGNLNYDLRKREWIDVPVGNAMVNRVEGGNVSLLLDAKRNLNFYDIASQTYLPVPVVRFSSKSTWRLIDDETLICVDQSGPIQFHVYRSRDGKLLKTFAPFQHVPYFLAAMLAAFLMWSVCWIRQSARVGYAAWIDVTLVAGLPIAFCAWRHGSTGFPSNDSRLTWDYLFGGLFGLLVLSAAWVGLGRYRWTMRLVLLQILDAAVILILRKMSGDRGHEYVVHLLRWHLTLCACVGCLIVLRYLGVRLSFVGSTAAEPTAAPRLSDLFMLTLAGALIIAATGPLPLPVDFTSLNLPRFELGWLVLVVLVMLAAGYSSHRSALAVGASLFSICLLALMVEPFTRFYTPFRLEQIYKPFSEWRFIFCAAVATFAAAIPYRLRGYRIGPSQRTSSEKERAK